MKSIATDAPRRAEASLAARGRRPGRAENLYPAAQNLYPRVLYRRYIDPFTRAGRTPPFRASVLAACPFCATVQAISRDARRWQCCRQASSRMSSSLTQDDVEVGHGPSCNQHGKKGQRGHLVYCANAAPAHSKILSTCSAAEAVSKVLREGRPGRRGHSGLSRRTRGLAAAEHSHIVG